MFVLESIRLCAVTNLRKSSLVLFEQHLIGSKCEINAGLLFFFYNMYYTFCIISIFMRRQSYNTLLLKVYALSYDLFLLTI